MIADSGHSHALRGLSFLYIFGCGGSGRETAWLAEEVCGSQTTISFVVDQARYLCTPVNGFAVQLLSDIKRSPNTGFVAAIGDRHFRHTAVTECIRAGLVPVALVHPHVRVSRWVEIGDGSIICAGSVLTTNIAIGSHTQINVGCTVSHDVRIGDFSTLSPGVHICGHVNVGNDVFIGAGACVINGTTDAPLEIGDGATIAAGACVTRSVAPQTLVAGVPAVLKR